MVFMVLFKNKTHPKLKEHRMGKKIAMKKKILVN